MIIYRIENKFGKGPYTGSHKHSWKDEGHDQRVPLAEHCSLYNDYIEIRNWCEESEENYPDLLQYGFSSMDQLESWFSQEEILRLKNLGYFIKEIEVKTFFDLNRQVAYIPK